MAEIALTLTGDESDVHAAYQRVIADQQRTIEGLSRMDAESRRSARAAQELARDARRVYDETRTPQERYQQRLEQLNGLLQRGAIDQQTYGRAAAEARQKLADQSGATERLRQKEQELERQQQELVRTQKELEAAGKRTWEATRSPLERYTQRIAELRRQLQGGAIDQETFGRAAAKAQQELDESGKSGESSMSGLASAGKAAAAAITAAFALASQAVADMRQTADEAAAAMQAARPAGGQLAQVASTPEELADLRAKAEGLFAAGAAPDLSSAQNAVFTMASTGQLGEYDLWRDVASSKLVSDATPAMEAINTLRAAMGAEETGDVRGMLSKALMAGKEGTGTMEQIIQAASVAGTSGSALGLRDEEMLAAIELMSQSSGGAAQAGTLLQRLLGKIERAATAAETAEEGESPLSAEDTTLLRSGTLAQKLDVIQRSGGMDSEFFAEFFADTEQRKAFRLLEQDQEKYSRYLGEIDQAAAQDVVGQRIDVARSDPQLAAAREAERSKARELLTREEMGTAANLADAVQDRFSAEMRGAGWNEWAIWSQRKLDNVNRDWSGDETFLRQELESGRIHNPELRQQVEAFLGGAAGQAKPGAPAADPTPVLKEIVEQQRETNRHLGRQRPGGPTMTDPKVDR